MLLLGTSEDWEVVVVEESAALVGVTLNRLELKKSFVLKPEMDWRLTETSRDRVELVSWGRVECGRRGRH